MGRMRIDCKTWPLVIFTLEGDLTQAQLDEHLREHRAVIDRNEPYAVVVDAMGMGSTEASFRKRYAEFISKNTPVLKRLCRGTAVVLQSPVARGAITAVTWMTTIPFPLKVFGDRHEALSWAKSQLGID